MQHNGIDNSTYYAEKCTTKQYKYLFIEFHLASSYALKHWKQNLPRSYFSFASAWLVGNVNELRYCYDL